MPEEEFIPLAEYIEAKDKPGTESLFCQCSLCVKVRDQVSARKVRETLQAEDQYKKW